MISKKKISLDFILFIWRWLITFYHVRSGMTKNGLKKKNWYSYNWSWENFSTPSRILLENYGHVHFQAFHSITLGEQRDLTLYFPRTKKKTVIPWLRTSAFHASQHIKTRRKSFIGLALTRRKEVEIYEKEKRETMSFKSR